MGDLSVVCDTEKPATTVFLALPSRASV